jgi:hypothetical protein
MIRNLKNKKKTTKKHTVGTTPKYHTVGKTCTFNFFFFNFIFYSKYYCSKEKNYYNDLRTVSLNKTNCSYLINRTHLIVLSVVLRQQRGYLFLHTFSYFHSWDLQLSSVCVIHSNGIIGKMQLD